MTFKSKPFSLFNSKKLIENEILLVVRLTERLSKAEWKQLMRKVCIVLYRDRNSHLKHRLSIELGPNSRSYFGAIERVVKPYLATKGIDVNSFEVHFI